MMEDQSISNSSETKVRNVRSWIVDKIASVIESILFAYAEPISQEELQAVFEQMDLSISQRQFTEAIERLQARYECSDSGLELLTMNGRYQLGTKKENYECLSILLSPIKKKSLTHASLETLSIIAYKQPITKSQIESIRGVKCDRAIQTLMQAGLIRENGRLEKIGRPIIYGTTEEFLKHFALSSLEDLPSVEDLAQEDAFPLSERSADQKK